MNLVLHFEIHTLSERAPVARSVWWLGYELDDRGLMAGRGWDFLSSRQRRDLLWGHPDSYTNGYGGGGGVRRPRREVEHTPT
jgi:hypothetical protein